jgi:hypothetical protein
MRKILYLVAALLLTANSFAQTPASFNYQAVIRDATGNIQANQNVAIDLKILQGKFSDSVVYTEFWNIQTNALGLINLEIGSKDSLAFGKINWQNGPFFIAVTVDGEYLGSSQLLSVPFSMQADKATFANTAQVAIDDKVDDADADPTNEIQDISLVGDQLSISGGSTVTLPNGGSDTPQTLSIAGQQLSISNGNTITIPDRFRDNDDDPTNELELPLQQASDANKSLVADGAGKVSWQTTAGGGVTETQVDAFVANNGYQLSADDADIDPANEIQDLLLISLQISNSI